MKTQTSSGLFPTLILATALVLAARTVPAQEIVGDTTATVAPGAGQTAPAPLLSYGVDQIIQLSKAKVSDDTIVNFIRASGSSYGLDASQIIYLKQQGVSDAVLNTMMSQPRPAPAVTSPDTPPAPTATVITYPLTADYQVAPIYATSSSVYVIPDSQTDRYASFMYNPYYGGRSYLGFQPYCYHPYGYQPYYYGSYIYYGNHSHYYGNHVTVIGHGGGGNYGGGWHR